MTEHPPSSAGNQRVLPRWFWIVVPILVVVAVAFVGIGLAVRNNGASASPTLDPVQSENRAMPAAIAAIPLVNQNGQTTDLAALRGKVVVLADFMTSCQEECPITTGALLSVQQALRADHLTKKVVVVEATVDPERDTPSRLLAYQKKFDVHWTMLTGTAADLHQLWKWFGVYYQRVAEDTPPNINWETGQPYTYDINHSDSTFVLGTSGNVEALVTGDANLDGHLPNGLTTLLDTTGREDLTHPGIGSWTPAELLGAVSNVLSEPIPQASQ